MPLTYQTCNDNNQLPTDVASILVENKIPRPSGGELPAEWMVEELEDGVLSDEEEAEEEEGEYDGGYEEDEEEDGMPRPSRASTVIIQKKRSARRRNSYEDDEEEEDDDEENDDETEDDRAYRLGLSAPIYKRERERAAAEGYPYFDDDDFGPTFTEQEPGLLPILVDKLAERVRRTPLLRPLLREDRFKYLLSQEADLR